MTVRTRTPSPVLWPLRMVRSLAIFLLELVRANLRVAMEVLAPGFRMTAGIIRVPTRTRTPLEVVVLANAISLTPGTLTLQVDEQDRVLYVHGLYVTSRSEFLRSIARIEDLVLDITRPRGRDSE
jgi:multicomponent Na+:H+ antiporter subunit E